MTIRYGSNQLQARGGSDGVFRSKSAHSSRAWCGFLPRLAVAGLGSFFALLQAAGFPESTATITVRADAPGRQISPDLIGIFFEDINYAADGGLYAEHVQNRSFEYSALERTEWHPLTAWEQVARDGARGTLKIADAVPVHPNNPHYVVVETTDSAGGFGLSNSGFDGIVVRAGEAYDFSVFARQLFTGTRWGGGRLDHPAELWVRLESKSGESLAETKLEIAGRDWQRRTARLTATKSDDSARLVVLSMTRGGIALDLVSLFPQKTFKNRANGLRADLAQSIANLKPKFMRFPGGCLVHGYGLGNLYRWQDTVGPVEQRRGQPNIWGYHQSVGLGYYEYFQFCEDIGAKPLPVVAAGVCCQNADHQGGTGQRGIPLDVMPGYIQEVLDLIEWANGPTNSKWGAVRAAAGHPAPFNLQYLGVGNEDHITPVFRERFKMIFDAVKAKHPEITVIGTVGPAPAGFDYTEGWQLANELRVPMVDEHYYESPQWFLNNLQRYDSYDRNGAKVYLGEYASRGNTWLNALAEAAYLTGLERNADIVPLASYAPLLGKVGHTQWNPNLIYFNNTRVVPTVNYYVQQLFSLNHGDVHLPTEISVPRPEVRPTGILLGTWDTQVEFKDVKVVSAGKPVVTESFQSDASNWTTEAGKWAVANGVYVQSAGGQPALAWLNPKIDRPDYTLTLKARKAGGSEGFLIGFGAQGRDNYFWWNLGGWDNSRHAIEKVSGGVKQTIGVAVDGKIEDNRWYGLKVVVEAGRIKCYLDGVKIHDVADEGSEATRLAASCVKETQTGDVILKLVNVTANPLRSQIKLPGLAQLQPTAMRTVLAGDLKAENNFRNPTTVLPTTGELPVSQSFACELPAHSLTVIRMKTK